jgi:DNA-binding NtrC family response regulator
VSPETTPLPLAGQGSIMRALAARMDELQRDVSRPVLLVGARGLGKRYLAQLLATTTADIVSLVTSKAFIETLYYRLYAWPMLLAALMDRSREDLVALADAVLEQTADTDADLPVPLSVGARDLLVRHRWPENLRELEATLALAQPRCQPHDADQQVEALRRRGYRPMTPGTITFRAGRFA